MTISRALGSTASGSFPQQNCNCRNCDGMRCGTVRATPRTQSSIVLGDGQHNQLVVNASPDILARLHSSPALRPICTPHGTGIVSVALMDAQIDHMTNLLMLREHRQALPVYASAAAIGDLSTVFPLTRMLSHHCGFDTRMLALNGTTLSVPPLGDVALTTIPLESKAPPYSPNRNTRRMGDSIGLHIVDRRSGRCALYAPGLARVEPHVLNKMGAADVMLVDGTCWHSSEMLALGFSIKMAANMGHLAQSGLDGMIDVLDQLPIIRKMLTHINNTDPILDKDSLQRRELEAHGIEVAYDGMEISS